MSKDAKRKHLSILPIKRKARDVIKHTLPTCICCNHSSWLQLVVERDRERKRKGL